MHRPQTSPMTESNTNKEFDWSRDIDRKQFLVTHQKVVIEFICFYHCNPCLDCAIKKIGMPLFLKLSPWFESFSLCSLSKSTILLWDSFCCTFRAYYSKWVHRLVYWPASSTSADETKDSLSSKSNWQPMHT